MVHYLTIIYIFSLNFMCHVAKMELVKSDIKKQRYSLFIKY